MRIRTALLIDPQGALRTSAEPGLERHGITLAAVTGYGIDALDAAFRDQPGLILIRLSSPAARPLDLIARLHDALPSSAIIALTSERSSSLAARAIAAGARVCLDEPCPAKQLSAAILAACEHFERSQQPPSLTAGRGARLITVTGARGGAGTTTLAVNLALAIYLQSGASVALVDANTRFGDVALALGLKSERSVEAAAAALDDPALRNPRDYMEESAGISVLPASSLPGPEMPPERFARLLDSLRLWFDFVVVDAPATMPGPAIAAAESATSLVLVANPTLACAADSARAIRSFRAIYGPADKRLHLVLNRAGLRGGLDAAALEREAGLAPRWAIADDPRVLKSTQLGVPAVERYPRIPASQSILEIAAAFAGRARSTPPGSPGGRGRAAFLRVLPRLVSG